MKYTGPTLAAKGGGDVAMEELVSSAESDGVRRLTWSHAACACVFDSDCAAGDRGGLPSRADVALFVGFVGRRRERPVPAALATDLERRRAGRFGRLARSPAEVDALLDVPVAVESWDRIRLRCSPGTPHS